MPDMANAATPENFVGGALTAGGVFGILSNRSPEQGEIAQLVERRTHKPKVKGSIPFLATIFPLASIGFCCVILVYFDA